MATLVKSPLPSAWCLVWTTGWILLGVFHLTQSIWVSRGEALPGSLGDGRFNQLVLEHGHQSWVAGHTPWLSPGQFHPTPNTLGLSDTHVGTLPFYSLSRGLGLSPERALQSWFVTVAGLNLLAAVWLLREAGIHPWLNGPVSFIAFAGVPWVWMTGTHAQLLPVFPALGAAGFAVRYVRDRQRSDLAIAGGALLAQFAAGPYLTFFSGLALLLLAPWAVGFCRPVGSRTEPTSKRPSKAVMATVAVGASLGLINLGVYLGAVSSGAGRPLQEVIDLSPEWVAWFSASPSHFWWPTAWPGGSPEHSEHVLFAGFLPGLLSLIVIVWAWPRRAQGLPRGALACSVTAWLIILGVVKWPGGFSLWITVAEAFEPVRAFRAIGRIHIITHALMGVAIGMAVSTVITSARPFGRTLALGLLGLLGLESLAGFQPSYSIHEARARREAVLAAWAEAGDRPVLAFAPGFTNQPDPHLQLDAWSAALASGRTTLNGYTGGAPLTHLQFIWNPHPEEALALARQEGIAPTALSIVTRFHPATAEALGFEYFDERSLRFLHGFELQPVSWDLFAPIEEFRFDAAVYYQFTPPASVRFRLPDPATQLHFVTGLRPGAHAGANDSDGYALHVRVRDAHEQVLHAESEVINPRDDPAARGFLARSVPLPAGSGRVLELTFGPGPSGSAAWDWPLLSQLRWE